MLPAQTLFLVAKGLSFGEIMWLESFLMIGLMLFEVPTGIIGDKVGRKWSIIFGDLVWILSWIPWFWADGFWGFALCFFLAGVSIAFESGSDQALVYDQLVALGQEKKMQKVYGYYLAIFPLAAAAAGLIGGWIAINHDMKSFYFLYMLIMVAQVVGMIIMLTVKEPRRSYAGEKIEHKPESGIKMFVDGAKIILGNKKMKKILYLKLLTTPFSIILFYAFQPYFLQAGVDSGWYGPAIFVSSLLTVLTKLYAHKLEEWWGVEKAVVIVSVFPALMWTVMALVFDPVWSFVLFVITDAAGNIRDPIFSDYFNRHIKSINRATILSTLSLMYSLYQVVMRPILGYIADIDMRYMFLTIALVIMSGITFFRLKKEDVVG